MAIGDSVLAFLVAHARLQPHHKVLDVGCGVGLAARPLTGFLSAAGGYDGFDVMREPIDWCLAQYQAFPNFRFCHADVFNQHYNPQGKSSAREYEFAYENDQFDLVVLTSVFTHLLPDDLQNYLAEIARVMKPGARCFITYFLLNSESNARIDQWLSDHPDESDRGVPGGLGFRWDRTATAVDSTTRTFPKRQWPIVSPGSEMPMRIEAWRLRRYRYGEWCRKSLQPGWQDAIVAFKRG